MNNFNEYLQQKRYSTSTLNGHLKNAGYFVQWLEDNQLYEAENVSRKNILEYVQYEQGRNLDTATINLRLTSISLYFEYLKSVAALGVGVRNPARLLRIKGKLKTVIEQPLNYEELEQLYYGYQSFCKEMAAGTIEPARLAHERNLIVVGMLIWQGLHSGELDKLAIHHINLNEGKIYIPSTARGNSRELRLHPQQILSLHTYLNGGGRK